MIYDFVNKKYSEGEIREYMKYYPERLDNWFWVYISECQTLSESFIREFQNKLLWHWLSESQNLSEKFLIEFIEKIDIKWFMNNEHIPKEVKQRIYNLKKVMES